MVNALIPAVASPAAESANPLRWIGLTQPNSYDMIDDSHFARFGMPRVYEGQDVNGGSFAAGDLSAFRVTEAVAALKGLNKLVMLNFERCIWSEAALPWIRAILDALRVRRPDVLVGMFDFRDRGMCDDLVDLWWPSATITAAEVPFGQFEKDRLLHWLAMHHATYHAAIRKAEARGGEVIPVLHTAEMNGDQIRAVLASLAMLPASVRRVACWANVARTDQLGYIQQSGKMQAIESRWKAINDARGVR